MVNKIGKGRKGQEEIMGFMLVVVMVVVIGLTLIFFLKPKQVEESDLQVENLLYSILSTSFGGGSISGHIEECGKGVGCDIMEKGLSEVTSAAFSKSGLVIGRNFQGYNINITGSVEYALKAGNATRRSIGSAVVSKDNLINLKFYY